MVGALKDKNVLIFRFLVVKDFLDLEGHGLARPHVGSLGEPAICERSCELFISYAIYINLRSVWQMDWTGGYVPLMVGCVISLIVVAVAVEIIW